MGKEVEGLGDEVEAWAKNEGDEEETSETDA